MKDLMHARELEVTANAKRTTAICGMRVSISNTIYFPLLEDSRLTCLGCRAIIAVRKRESEQQTRTSDGLLTLIEKNQWAIVPPNQESNLWTIYKEFDGEFGYDQEIGWGRTLITALELAASWKGDVK